MHSASYQPSSGRGGKLFSRRAAATVPVVALHLLALFLVLGPAPSPPRLPAGGLKPIVVRHVPEAREEERKAVRRPSREPLQAAPAPATKPPQTAEPLPEAPSIWSQVIPLTREEFAAADIGSMPERPAARAPDGAEAAGDAEVTATGPNGERLYEAEWHRRPTHAELAYYVPSGAPSIGWGIIACRTIADYRVDDCREIDQSPPGSGLARAVLQAAWQFRVRPPRIGGRPLVGAWVRIRIEYTQDGAK